MKADSTKDNSTALQFGHFTHKADKKLKHKKKKKDEE